MTYGPLAHDETVVLVDDRGRRYLKRLKSGHRMTVRGTVIRADDLIGHAEGSLAGEGGAEKFRVFRASYAELATNIERPAEPIFCKDAGTLIVRGDLRAGDRVLEVGVGAGTLTIALLRAIGPAGTLVSYEIRADFAETARRNVRSYHGDAPNWELVVGDAREGIREGGFDRVVADVPDPAALLAPLAVALRFGGTLIAYVPTVLQVKELHDGLAATAAFGRGETYEVLERRWHVEGRSVRPEHRMVAHTGFLTFARRLAD